MRYVGKDIHALVLHKDKHQFVFMLTADKKDEMLQQFGLMASDPDNVFSWYDAAVLSQRLRAMLFIRSEDNANDNT